MSKGNTTDNRFGQIAVDLNLCEPEKLDRALVIQRCIYNRTQVHMPIGKVLKEMGVLTQAQIDSVLEAQRAIASEYLPSGASDSGRKAQDPDTVSGMQLSIDKDRLAAYLSLNGEALQGITLGKVQQLLEAHGVVFGLVSDEAISAYLAQNPLPAEPFRVACGKPARQGQPSQIRFHFDTDPLRIGTVLDDGTIDWKNRGDVPEVKAGDLLAEKVGGDPGEPGRAVTGEEIFPPKIKEPQIKCARGAERSEDGLTVVAKLAGMPKLTQDGRITVMSVLTIDGDIGIETGHVDFDGYIEVEGGVNSGYRVAARGLQTREIQNAEVDIDEDLVSFGGIYSTKGKVGGNVKASHIHNSSMRITGDLVVEKEVIGSTIEVNGRVILDRGKIIGSKITAKKGIQVRDVGTEASPPSELTVGVDRNYQRGMQACKETLDQLEAQEAELAQAEAQLRKQADDLSAELGEVAQLQDKYMLQMRQYDEKMNGPKAVTDEDERVMLVEMIAEFNQRQEAIDQQVKDLMVSEDAVRSQHKACLQSQAEARAKVEEIKREMVLLEEDLKNNPGLPVLKISGKVHARTVVAGLHKKLKLSQEMISVRVAESKSESGSNAWQIKISNLR